MIIYQLSCKQMALQYQDIKNVHKTTYQNIDC